ncbi:unnamed protein product, partial [marine sediment metagenome]
EKENLEEIAESVETDKEDKEVDKKDINNYNSEAYKKLHSNLMGNKLNARLC